MSRKTRRELLQAVTGYVSRTGDPTVPWEEIPGLAAEFGSPEEVLAALQRRWYTRLSAHLDALLEDPPPDLSHAVRELWKKLVADEPGARALLDAYRDHPAVARAEESQRRLLTRATAGELDALPRLADDQHPLPAA